MRVGALALLGLAAACGTRSVSFEEFEREYPIAYCDLRVDCGWFPDREACLEVGVASATLVELRAAEAFIDHGTIGFDGELAATCLDELSRMRCDHSSFAQIPLGRGLCRSPLRGRVPEGGTCVLGAECADGRRCWVPADCTAACCTGTCIDQVVWPQREIGESCGGDGAPGCVPEAYCSFGTCEPLRAEGEACETEDACQRGSVCLSGVCRGYVAEGAACGPAQGDCDRYDNVCADGICQRAPLPGHSCVGNACIGYAACLVGDICVAKPMPGEPCTEPDPRGLRWCLGDAMCEGDLCVALEPAECTPEMAFKRSGGRLPLVSGRRANALAWNVVLE